MEEAPSSRERTWVGGLIAVGVGAVLTAIGLPLLVNNRTRVTFADGTRR